MRTRVPKHCVNIVVWAKELKLKLIRYFFFPFFSFFAPSCVYAHALLGH